MRRGSGRFLVRTARPWPALATQGFHVVTVAGQQDRLDDFRLAYERRSHRAIGRRTPAAVYGATPKALPPGTGDRGHFRLRYDVTDRKGALTLPLS